MKNKLLLALAVAIALLTSCTSAPKHLAKAIAKDEPYVAEQTRLRWPCVVTGADTVTVVDTVTDIISVQCPDSVAYRVDSFETVTAVRVPVYVKVPVQREVKTITVVQKVEDSAKIYTMQAATEELQARNDKLHEQSDKYKAARNKWRKWCLWTWGILAAGGVLWVLRKRYF